MANISKEEFKQLLRVFNPALYTMDIFTERFIKDMKMQFGEIHFKAMIQNGKIVRIEAYPIISQKVDNLT
jgi:hypothetical protein